MSETRPSRCSKENDHYVAPSVNAFMFLMGVSGDTTENETIRSSGFCAINCLAPLV